MPKEHKWTSHYFMQSLYFFAVDAVLNLKCKYANHPCDLRLTVRALFGTEYYILFVQHLTIHIIPVYNFKYTGFDTKNMVAVISINLRI